MINLSRFIQLLKQNNLFLFPVFKSIKYYSYNIKAIFNNNSQNVIVRINNFLSLNFLLTNDIQNFLDNSLFNKVILLVDHIKVQELTFLAEYYLVTTLFCLTLFALFSFKLVLDEKHFLIRFQYNNQLIFLLIFGLTCYLILVYQQYNLSMLSSTSFNYTILNDQLSVISKLIIGISSIIYLIFITQYLKDQKLNNFEYYIILLTSIFGFFLLCGANDLITAYLAIELQGLAFYVLASFKKSSNFSIESGVKYFVLGSLSTAIFLLGVTFVYGFSGSVLLTDFKDFFIWVFSANSFFLSLESISSNLNLNNDFDSNELQVISDNFALTFNDFGFNSDNIQKQDFFKGVSKEMFESFSSVDKFSYWYYQDAFDLMSKTNNTIDFGLLGIENNSWLIYDFLLEYQFLDVYLSMWYEMQNFEIFSDFVLQHGTSLKELFIYEFIDENMKKNYEDILFQPGILKESPVYSSIVNVFESDSSVLGLNELLFNFMMFSDLEFNNTDINQFPNEFTDIITISEVFNYPSYLFSIVNINNLSNLIVDNNVINNINNNSYFMFDLSFLIMGMLIILLALFFKLALAPFHLWAPDVYEGSPSSSTFFFMIISKFSLFVFLLRFCYSSFYSFISYWQFYSLLIATISIFVGAVAGLKQRRLKSLLTYSSINNMGFVLLAFSVGGFEGVQIKFYYLIIYILSGLCLWAIILNLKLHRKNYFEKQNRDIGDLALLQESNNSVAQNLGVTLFALAGLPPMVSFLAKMGVFKALSGVSIFFFSVINILFSVIATFYYLRIIKIIFFENLLVGNLYASINTKKTFIINLLTFLLLFLFISPMFLYFYSYKITLLLNKSFY